MSIREKNGKWQYRFMIGYSRTIKDTGLAATEANRAKAEKMEQRHRDEILKGILPSGPRRQFTRRFGDLCLLPSKNSEDVGEFVSWVQAEHREKSTTIHRVLTSLASLIVFFENKPIASINAAEIESYKQWRLVKHDVKPITLRHDLDNLSKFFEWAIRMEYATTNPVKLIDKPSSEAERMYILSAAEEFEYFEFIRHNMGLSDAAQLMIDQGLGPEEVCELEARGFDPKQGTIQIFDGKRPARRRLLKLAPESLVIIERRSRQTRSRWLFWSERKEGRHMLPRSLTNAHIRELSLLNQVRRDRIKKEGRIFDEEVDALRFVLYDLRHSFATRAAQGGMDLLALAKALGHNSIRLVQKYAHIQQGHLDRVLSEVQRKQHEERLRYQQELRQRNSVVNDLTLVPVGPDDKSKLVN